MANMTAYILVQTEVGKMNAVADAIRALPGITQADSVTGPYDVIARADVSTMDELGRKVLSAVQQIPGITRTITCPVVNFD
jgi:DNA-binding Lrp family transcriptional regulator